MELLKDVGIGLTIVVPLMAGFAFVPLFMLILVLVVCTLLVAGMIGSIIRG